jgi:Na+-translocating ferredoxin:NAD+ oxidoreductase subunit C
MITASVSGRATRPRRTHTPWSIAAAGILGLGGALFPTARKLAMPGITVLLINGAECEPYISCDDALLRARADAVVTGTRLLLRAAAADRAVIAVKTDMPEARVALYNALATAADPRLGLTVVTAKYPAGGERQLIELIFEREVPTGCLPPTLGVVVQNVATAAAVADFFQRGAPLTSRVVTVTGSGVAHPRNVEARLGTPVADLVAAVGGYQNQPTRLIMGGPMMGIALDDDALPITAATNCLIAATEAELGTAAPELPCIRCGACVEACPAALQPQDLVAAARRGDAPGLLRLGIADCIECGACDYVCPSHIPLTATFSAARGAAADHQQQRDAASDARQRHEARTARLERLATEQQQSLAGLKPESRP